MNDFTAYMYIVLGVVVAVVLPILAAAIRKEFPVVQGIGFPPWLRRYMLLFVFSLVVAIASLAVWRSQNPNAHLQWYSAFMIGFGWESALEKFLHPKP